MFVSLSRDLLNQAYAQPDNLILEDKEVGLVVETWCETLELDKLYPELEKLEDMEDWTDFN